MSTDESPERLMPCAGVQCACFVAKATAAVIDSGLRALGWLVEVSEQIGLPLIGGAGWIVQLPGFPARIRVVLSAVANGWSLTISVSGASHLNGARPTVVVRRTDQNSLAANEAAGACYVVAQEIHNMLADTASHLRWFTSEHEDIDREIGSPLPVPPVG